MYKVKINLFSSTIPLLALLFFFCFNFSNYTLGASPPVTVKEPIQGREQLNPSINAVLNSAELQSSFAGIHIIDLESKKVLFSHNSDKLFHPASTVKLYTTAAALTHLGATHRFHTELAIQAGNKRGSTLDGNLWIIGAGDPTLNYSNLQKLAESIDALGVNKITGNIICDASIFDDIHYGKGWMWDDQPYKDFAPISALSVNRNTITVSVTPGSSIGSPPSVSVSPPTGFVQIKNNASTSKLAPLPENPDFLTVLRRWKTQENIVDITGNIAFSSPKLSFTRNIVFPARFAGTLLKEILSGKGITFQGEVVTGNAPEKLQVIASHSSDELKSILRGMNKNSHNLDAEMLLKAVGQKATGQQGSDENGLETLFELLNNWGINPDGYTFADGSGVSRYNLLTPKSQTDFLQFIYNNPEIYSDFYNSLPIAGVDGNLIDRMKGTAAENKIRAKTGAMTGVSGLVGFAQSASGKTIAFSILIEHFIGSHQPFRLAQDKICALLCRYVDQ